MITQNMERAQRLQFDADLRGPLVAGKTAAASVDRENARSMQNPALMQHGMLVPPKRKPRPIATDR
jgi:hypothetical protein